MDDSCVEIRPLFSGPLNGFYSLDDISLEGVQVFARNVTGLSSTANEPALFMDDVWPASYVLSDYLVNHVKLCTGMHVLELGSGAALPSCVADRLGAAKVVITDYPAEGALENIQNSIELNNLRSAITLAHIWGNDIDKVKSQGYQGVGYHTILMADVLWKDTYTSHRDLLQTVKLCLLDDPHSVALIGLAHRPTEDHSPERDLEFFELASSEFEFNVAMEESSTKYVTGSHDDFDVEVFVYSMKHSVGGVKRNHN